LTRRQYFESNSERRVSLNLKQTLGNFGTDNAWNTHNDDEDENKSKDPQANLSSSDGSNKLILKKKWWIGNLCLWFTYNLGRLQVNSNLPVGGGRYGCWLGSDLPCPTGARSALLKIIKREIITIYAALGTRDMETRILPIFSWEA